MEKVRTAKGVLWSAVENIASQGIRFVIGIIIANILSPSEFGLVGMLSVFIAVSDVLISCGFTNALIHKQNRTEIDFSTIFYTNLATSIFLYWVLFFSAPLIASYYDKPLLIPLLRVLSLNLIMNSMIIVPKCKLIISVNYKKISYITLISGTFSGLLGIFFALHGWGVWALVNQMILYYLVSLLLYSVFAKWRPLFSFSFQSFKELFSFGFKLAISGIINSVFNNIYSLIIGKKYKDVSLGLYSRADMFAQTPATSFSDIISRVAYTELCKIKDKTELLRYSRLYFRLVAFIIFPFMMGLYVVTPTLIKVILPSNWYEVIPLLQLLCFAYLWLPLTRIHYNLFQVTGKPGFCIITDIISKSIFIIVTIIMLNHGVKSLCLGIIFINFMSLIVNALFINHELKYSLLLQFKDLLPSAFYTIAMCLIILFFSSLFNALVLKLIVSIFVGIISYFLISNLCKSRELKCIFSLVKSMI